MSLTLTSFGAARTVTGSKHLVEYGKSKILVDCGQFQGLKALRERNWQPLPLNADNVILTHAHLDHCGLLPLLVKEGYGGKIHATAGTVELAGLVLLDSGKLHEEFAKREARWEKRHPDEVAADDRREADQYEAAVELAAAGEVAIAEDGAEAAGEHVPTTIEPEPPAWPADP